MAALNAASARGRYVSCSMQLDEKLAILADAAKYDASCASSGSKRETPKDAFGRSEQGICHSYTPDGRCVSLLRILLTNFCIFDCHYCVNRISNDIARAVFSPEEVVRLTLDFYRRNYIEGLFLSSGILKSPDHTMEQLIRVARTLREEHRFGGYIHLKAVAGASDALLLEAGRWADRLSANIELPTAGDLQKLAPEKSASEIESAMATIANASTAAAAEPRRDRTFAPAGQSTQMIVGATETSDASILEVASTLYDRYKLRRVYYTGFSPIPGADPRLPAKSPPLIREHRLYQADWLVRLYGFKHDELLEPGTSLDLEKDPKLAWALRRRDLFPIDVNTAPRELLLRIPGIGIRNVERILSVRRWHALALADLQKMRVPLQKAQPFLVTTDHRPVRLLDDVALGDKVAPESEQLELFSSRTAARSGEV